MNLDEVLQLHPTLPEYTSEQLLLELFRNEDLRCYAATTCDETRELSERFLRYHASVPGLLSKESRAHTPVSVFFKGNETEYFKGALFLNGAVVASKTDKSEGLRISLFIDESLAVRANYPDTGFIYMAQAEQPGSIQ